MSSHIHQRLDKSLMGQPALEAPEYFYHRVEEVSNSSSSSNNNSERGRWPCAAL
jgi:hypothetical protein